MESTMKKLCAFILMTTYCALCGISSAAILDVPGTFATIQAGIDFAAKGDTVLVAPGTYYEHVDLSDKEITLASHYLTTQDTMYMHETIIDGSADGTCITIKNTNGVTTPRLAGFTVQNAGYIITVNYGSGLRCSDADPIVEYMIFKDNASRVDGGGCNFVRSNPLLDHVWIFGNDCWDYGGGAYFFESNPVMKNVFIIDNSGSHGGGLNFSSCDSVVCENVIIRNSIGGVIQCDKSTLRFNFVIIQAHNTYEIVRCSNSKIVFVNSSLYGIDNLGILSSASLVLFINSIVWLKNTDSQIQVGNMEDIPQNILVFENSVLKDGIEGIVGIFGKLIINKDIFISDNTISNDPLFIDSLNGDFRLQNTSPCIDAGTAFFEWEGETILDYSADDYKGSTPDIGCYEYDPSIGVKKDASIIPSVIVFSPYPNPFNASVTIPYQLSSAMNITVSIYNLSGQKVQDIFSGYKTPGFYTATWDATGFASGTYYCMVNNGHSRQIRKIQYLK